MNRKLKEVTKFIQYYLLRLNFPLVFEWAYKARGQKEVHKSLWNILFHAYWYVKITIPVKVIFNLKTLELSNWLNFFSDKASSKEHPKSSWQSAMSQQSDSNSLKMETRENVQANKWILLIFLFLFYSLIVSSSSSGLLWVWTHFLKFTPTTPKSLLRLDIFLATHNRIIRQVLFAS